MNRLDFAFPATLRLPTGGYGATTGASSRNCGRSARRCVKSRYPRPSVSVARTTSRQTAGCSRTTSAMRSLSTTASRSGRCQGNDLRSREAGRSRAPPALPRNRTGASPRGRVARIGNEGARACRRGPRHEPHDGGHRRARLRSACKVKLFLAEPGIDRAPRATGSSDGIVRLLSVGSLLPRKGYGDLLHALSGVTGEWSLTIVGETRSRLRTQREGPARCSRAAGARARFPQRRWRRLPGRR